MNVLTDQCLQEKVPTRHLFYEKFCLGLDRYIFKKVESLYTICYEFIVNCSWSAWSDWTSCSKTCGNGIRVKSRKVEIPAKNGGSECLGRSRQTQTCNNEACDQSSKTCTNPRGCFVTTTPTTGSITSMPCSNPRGCIMTTPTTGSITSKSCSNPRGCLTTTPTTSSITSKSCTNPRGCVTTTTPTTSSTASNPCNTSDQSFGIDLRRNCETETSKASCTNPRGCITTTITPNLITSKPCTNPRGCVTAATPTITSRPTSSPNSITTSPIIPCQDQKGGCEEALAIAPSATLTTNPTATTITIKTFTITGKNSLQKAEVSSRTNSGDFKSCSEGCNVNQSSCYPCGK